MTDYLFEILYDALAGNAWLALPASLGWGVLSVILSPCHLAGIPLIVGVITNQEGEQRKSPFMVSVVFSLGILITIAIIGLITAALGRIMGDTGEWGKYLATGIMFIVGLYLMDVINPVWRGFELKQVSKNQYISAFVIGLLFGFALGPCTFAFMAPVLGLVFETGKSNMPLAGMYMAAFAAGHCLIILFAGIAAGKVGDYLSWSNKTGIVKIIKNICGVLVIAGGFYFLFN